MALNATTSILMRRGRGRADNRQVRRWRSVHRGRARSPAASDDARPAPPGSWERRNGLPRESLRGVWPSRCLGFSPVKPISRFWPPTLGECTSVVLSRRVRGHLLQQPQDIHTERKDAPGALAFLWPPPCRFVISIPEMRPALGSVDHAPRSSGPADAEAPLLTARLCGKRFAGWAGLGKQKEGPRPQASRVKHGFSRNPRPQ